MNNKSYLKRNKTNYLLAVVAIAGLSLGIYSCNKQAGDDAKTATSRCGNTNHVASATPSGKTVTYQTLTSTVTVAGIRTMEGSSNVEVFFNENTEFFTVTNESTLAIIKTAFSTGNPINITFDPWQGVVTKATYAATNDAASLSTRNSISTGGTAKKVDLSHMANDALDNPSEMGIMNTTDPGLNNVIPDFATAQLMFDYICRQCCYLPGPYAIDYCIPFQYCIDGCYARAHKMCWIINNRYKYGTKKIFSFANAGSDKLCVQGQKWGGCCIRWWYHVAPLVTIQTTTGPKAYVFDPAMFNQPVLLSTWLHAQENPACAASYTPNVTMINVQPTASYAPSGSSGMTFSTDPTYSATNTTLNNYRYLVTCP